MIDRGVYKLKTREGDDIIEIIHFRLSSYKELIEVRKLGATYFGGDFNT